LPLWLLPDKIENSIFKNLYNNTIGSHLYQNNKKIIYRLTGGLWNVFNKKVKKGDLGDYYNDFNLRIYVESEYGTDIEILNEINKRIEKKLLDYSKYISYFSTNIYNDFSYIKVDFKNEYKYSSFPYFLKNELSILLTEFGGINSSILGFGDPLTAGSVFSEVSIFNVSFYGYNYQKLKNIAMLFKEQLEKNPRIENIDIDKVGWGKSGYQIIIDLNRKKISEYGLSIADILNLIYAHIGGSTSSHLVILDNEEVKINVKFETYKEYELYNLMNLRFIDKSGKSFLLSDLANIYREKLLKSIIKSKQQYTRKVTFDYIGPYELGKNYLLSTLNSISLPYGYSVDTGLFFSNFESRSLVFTKIIIAAILLLFMITSCIYESFKKPLIILMVLPLAMIGVFLIYYFTESYFTTGSYAGLILLFGLAVNNSIILVDYISKLEKRGLPVHKAIIYGSIRRTKPILMTSVTTFIGFIPFVTLTNQNSIWYGISLSVIGGIISSSIIVLFIVPCIYYIIFHKKNNYIP